MTTARRIGRDLLTVLILVLGAMASAQAVERFSYCGTLRVTGGLQTPEGTVMPAMPMMPFIGGYVGPLGITPMPPRTCVYVTPGPVRDGRHVPAIVVWSDMGAPMPYHADIYSDAGGIFGHRREQPSDFEPAGLMARTREMEAFLDAAAGGPVLLAVLDALRQGQDKTSLDRDLIPLFLSGAAGQEVTLSGHYEITEIRADARFPAQVGKLMGEGRKRRHPHSPQWKPITIPAGKAP